MDHSRTKRNIYSLEGSSNVLLLLFVGQSDLPFLCCDLFSGDLIC